MIYLLDIFGTFVFAVTGAMVSSHKKMDLFGAFILAFVTATGGGTLRDMVLGNTPVFWVDDINYVLAVICGVTAAFFFAGFIKKLDRPMLFFDAVGLGVFTLVGANKAASAHVSTLSVILLSVITAVMGGIIRDILGGDVPLIFKKEIYATACFSGALLYVLLKSADIPALLVTSVPIATVILIRLISIRYNISLPGITIRSRYEKK